MPVLDAIPPVRGRMGRPRHKPDSLFADRGYDIYRDQVRERAIVPSLARRGTRHGTGHLPLLVIERSFVVSRCKTGLGGKKSKRLPATHPSPHRRSQGGMVTSYTRAQYINRSGIIFFCLFRPMRQSRVGCSQTGQGRG